MPTVHELCAHHAEADVVATGDDGTRTLQQLLVDARTIATRLEGFPRGGEIVLVCHDRYHFAASLLAAIDRELCVALPPNAQPETIKLLREGGSVLTVLTDQDGTPGIDVRACIGVGKDALRRPRIPEERRMVVVYTSGSTGSPMACTKTAGQLFVEATVLARTFAIAPRSPIVATVPPHHIYGLLFSVLLPLVSGASFCRESPLHADAVRSIVSRDRARVLVSVPAHLRALSIMSPEGTETLRRIFSSGAPLQGDTRAMLAQNFGWKVTEVLGSSETGGVGFREEADAPFVTFDVVEVEVGEDDRMLVSSPYLPPESQRRFATGDRIELLGPRTFRHLGRMDGVLKIGSTRVSVAELEGRLRAISGIEDAAVLAVPAAGGRGHETWAALVRAPGSTLDAAAVRRALRPWLDPVVIPRRYRFVEALPRDGTGKLKKDALRALFDGEVT